MAVLPFTTLLPCLAHLILLALMPILPFQALLPFKAFLPFGLLPSVLEFFTSLPFALGRGPGPQNN